MSSFFNIDSPLMRGLSKVADLMILNLLVILTCLPIITVGASLSAMHYVLIKLTRNEGTSVAQMYFKSFKENFKQGTILWLVPICAICLFVYDLYLFFFTTNTMPAMVFIAVMVVGVLMLMTCIYFFPLQARFINPVSKTIRNAFFVMVLNFPKTIVIIILYAIPVAMVFMAYFMIPFVLLFGISAPSYGAALLYKKVFEKIEPKEQEITEDIDFRVE